MTLNSLSIYCGMLYSAIGSTTKYWYLADLSLGQYWWHFSCKCDVYQINKEHAQGYWFPDSIKTVLLEKVHIIWGIIRYLHNNKIFSFTGSYNLFIVHVKDLICNTTKLRYKMWKSIGKSSKSPAGQTCDKKTWPLKEGGWLTLLQFNLLYKWPFESKLVTVLERVVFKVIT